MKRLLFFAFIISLSCENPSEKKLEYNSKSFSDSIRIIEKRYQENIGNRFYALIKKETESTKDSILIPKYKNLLGQDSLMDLYIWDRIRSINNLRIKTEVINSFKGKYRLKPNHNKAYSSVHSIEIKSDSIYLFKNKLLIADKLDFKNSSSPQIFGKILVGQYRLILHDAFEKGILLDDNLCMDCEQLQFMLVEKY